MSEPFIAEIKIVGFNFAPRGWALCDGQILPINQNQSLYSLLGTTYGGDGRTSFALPDLRGRSPIHEGSGHLLGSREGSEGEAISSAQMPGHGHDAKATSAAATSTNAAGNLLGDTADARFSITPYADLTSPQALVSTALANAGASQPHDNMQPFLALNFCIALQGLFPSRN
jgi:microcystin-dependent protein